MKYVHKALNANKAVDILYLNFRKAFDTVSHNIVQGILNKLY